MDIQINNPQVSIVILNWNSKPFIHNCIESVYKQSYINYEVIFVDNNSTDGSLEECKEKYPEFIYVENKDNLGFSGGMNTGISLVRGKYCLLLNTDVYLDSNYLHECVTLLENDTKVVCTAGYEYKWRYPDFTNDKVGSGVFGIATHLRIVNTNAKSKYVFGVSGSFPVFRSSFIHEVINKRNFFFDPKFQTGWEDTDVRFLLILLGYKTQLCKNTKAWHIGSAADNGNTGMFQKNLNYQKRIFRNRMFIIEKYIKPNFLIWPMVITFINIILKLYIKRFQPNSINSYDEAIKEFKQNRSLIKEEVSLIKPNYKCSKFELLKYLVRI